MYKVILLDYSMPEMDGPQVATEIRRMLSNSILAGDAQVPFICCCTAYAEASFKGRALQLGMDHFMTKPLDQRDLNEVISHLN